MHVQEIGHFLEDEDMHPKDEDMHPRTYSKIRVIKVSHVLHFQTLQRLTRSFEDLCVSFFNVQLQVALSARYLAAGMSLWQWIKSLNILMSWQFPHALLENWNTRLSIPFVNIRKRTWFWLPSSLTTLCMCKCCLHFSRVLTTHFVWLCTLFRGHKHLQYDARGMPQCITCQH